MLKTFAHGIIVPRLLRWLLHGPMRVLPPLGLTGVARPGGLVVFQQVGTSLNETVKSFLNIGLIVNWSLLLLACGRDFASGIPRRRDGHGSRPDSTTTEGTPTRAQNTENSLLKLLWVLSSGSTLKTRGFSCGALHGRAMLIETHFDTVVDWWCRPGRGALRRPAGRAAHSSSGSHGRTQARIMAGSPGVR